MARAGRSIQTVDAQVDSTADQVAAQESRASLPGGPQSPDLQQSQSLPKLKEPVEMVTGAGSQAIPGAALAAGSQAE